MKWGRGQQGPFGWLIWLGVVLIVGCAPAPVAPSLTPTLPAVAVLPTTPATATLTPLPAPSTPTPLPSPLPPPSATPTTALPTLTPPPLPSPTETVSATPTSVFACRAAAELAGVQPLYGIAPGPWPRPAAWPDLVFAGTGSSSLIQLGFDVEGSPARLGELLDILDRRGVKTTMFILGSWAETYPDWVREMARRGHEMANHTYSHGNMRDMTPEQVVAELNRTEEIVQALTGQSTKPWLRPPFGSRSDESVRAAYEAGWTTVIWSGSADDWREDATADRMCQTMREGSFPGSILYAHTYHTDMPETIDRYLGEMQSRGYTFAPLSVLMDGNPTAWLTSP